MIFRNMGNFYYGGLPVTPSMKGKPRLIFSDFFTGSFSQAEILRSCRGCVHRQQVDRTLLLFDDSRKLVIWGSCEGCTRILRRSLFHAFPFSMRRLLAPKQEAPSDLPHLSMFRYRNQILAYSVLCQDLGTGLSAAIAAEKRKVFHFQWDSLSA